MRPRPNRLLGVVVALAALAPASVVSADVAPPPQRPKWGEHPPPMPPLPPEKDFERALLATGIGAAALTVVLARRRARRERVAGGKA